MPSKRQSRWLRLLDGPFSPKSQSGTGAIAIIAWNFSCFPFLKDTSPAGSLLAVKLHSENGVISKGKYEILISLILQWQDNPRQTMRNQLS